MVDQSQILSPQIDYDSQCQIIHIRNKIRGKSQAQDSKSVDQHFTTQDAIEEESILKPSTSSESAEIDDSIQSTPQANYQRPSSSLIVELDSARTTYDDLEQIRKTKRLLAIFRLWHSKTEIQQQQQKQIQLERDLNRNVNVNVNVNDSIRQLSARRIECLENNETTLSSTSNYNNHQSRPTSSSCNYHNHISRRNHLMFIPTCASNMPFATNIMPELLSESLSERKLWQSLVMPLVLGCIIFLVIIWTRQISLVLMDDTIVMIVILGSVFILMSGIAFWLAQDQSMTENNNNNNNSNNQEQQQQSSTSNHDWSTTSTTRGESTRHHCRYQHRSSSSHQHSAGNHHQVEDDKQYNVSVIECQPPDYYSAITNSHPVDIYCLKEKKKEDYENQSTTNRNNLEVGSSLEIIDSDPPPSYHEWSTLGGNMCSVNIHDSYQRRSYNNSLVSATSVKAPQ